MSKKKDNHSANSSKKEEAAVETAEIKDAEAAPSDSDSAVSMANDVDGEKDINQTDQKDSDVDVLSDQAADERIDAENIEQEKSLSDNQADTKSVTAELPTEHQSATTEEVTKKASKNILVMILLLLLIIVMGVMAYFSWTHWQVQSERLDRLESQSSNQTSILEKFDGEQAASVKQQQANISALKQSLTKQQTLLQQRLDSHAQRLSALSGTTRDDWMLAEARYLLRLANQRLLVDGGAIGAVGLLESADKILVSIDSPDLFPIRDAVSKDIIALKLAPSIDREGLYLQLAALIAQIDQLPLVPLSREALQKEIAPADEHASKNTAETLDGDAIDKADQVSDKPWYQSMWVSIQKAFGRLDRYIKVSDHDAESRPLVSSALQQQVRQDIRLTLEQTQIALLREEDKIYRQSLKQAAALVNQHFTHYAERQALVNELSRLQRQPIIQSLPDISRSLELLTQYTERFHKLTPEVKKTDQLKKKSESKAADQTSSGKQATLPKPVAPLKEIDKKDNKETAI